ncbi:MAG: DUF4350 domain-containing protein [Cyanobacteria bacterium J06623_7]
MPNLRQRKWLFLGIAIAIIVVLTLVAAPNSGNSKKNSSGSTYSTSPDGYGAWYEYMQEQDVAIDRWRQPLSQLIEDEVSNVAYIRVLSRHNSWLGFTTIAKSESEWVSQGNTLVILGKYEPATNAPFNSAITHRRGTLASRQIEITTTRRLKQSPQETEKILVDAFGTVVWSEKIGAGEVIYCTTPYLAANAYQENIDNYRFLAELVSDRQAIWVDEYIHGHRQRETATKSSQASLLDYLVQTPWFLLFTQAVLIAILAAVVNLRRFGQPVKPKIVIADNSTAYIEALAGVLTKANSSDFVVAAIAKDERQKLQQTLGLGKSLVDRQTLIDAYKQQQGTGNLGQLLSDSNSGQKISPSQLLHWIRQWQNIKILD